MGFDLHGRGGYVSVNINGWERLFNLALDHGWVPEREYQTWIDTYFMNDGHIVSDLDAMRFSEALERAAGSCEIWEDRTSLFRFATFMRQGQFEIW